MVQISIRPLLLGSDALDGLLGRGFEQLGRTVNHLLDREAYHAASDLHSLRLVDLKLDGLVGMHKSTKLGQIVFQIVAVRAFGVVLEDGVAATH